MSRRMIFVLVLIGTIALAIWRSQLFTVSAPGEVARPLVLLPAAERTAFTGDVVLPVVPVGLQRLHPEAGVTVIHYWAPWEKGSLEQAQSLDSLRHEPALQPIQAWLVTFDPFPSVARYVGRNRLGVPVLLDGGRELRHALPCPSIPYTYVIDNEGRVVVAQPGRVDWLAKETIEMFETLVHGPAPGHGAPSTPGATRVKPDVS